MTNTRKFGYCKIFGDGETVTKDKIVSSGVRTFLRKYEEVTMDDVIEIHGFIFVYEVDKSQLTEVTSGAKIIHLSKGDAPNRKRQELINFVRSKTWEQLNEVINIYRFGYVNPIIDVIINI